MKRLLLAITLLAASGCAGLDEEPEAPYVAVRTRDLYSMWSFLAWFADHTYIVWRDVGDAVPTVAERNYNGVRCYEDGWAWDKEHETHSLLTGAAARAAITRLKLTTSRDRDAHTSRYGDGYVAWPGPNSNSYAARLCRDADVPVDLPPDAVGKDWPDLIPHVLGAGLSTSGLGVRFDLLGIVGFQIGLVEGIEVHLLGTSVGIAFWPPAIKLPFVSRIGF